MPEEKDAFKEQVSAWQNLSYIPPKRVDPDKDRTFPRYTKASGIVRTILFALEMLSAVTILVLEAYYAIFDKIQSYKFSLDDNGYGILGATFFAVLILVSVFFFTFSYLYDTKLVDSKKTNKCRKVVDLSIPLIMAFFFTAIAFTSLRPYVLHTSKYPTYIGYLIMICVWIVTILFVIFEFLLKEKKKLTILHVIENILYSILILSLTPLTAYNYSLISPFSVWMFSFGLIAYLIAFFCYLNEKKNANYRTTAEFFKFTGVALYEVGLLVYGMILVK